MMRSLFSALVTCVVVLVLSVGSAFAQASGDDTPNYQFIPGEMYRMPTHFGPSTGPRRGPHGQKFENRDAPKTTSISVSFLTNAGQLERMLPEGFSLDGEPVVSVGASYIKEIPWLAGRGYNTLGVSFPVIFQGKKDRAQGRFLLVLWENLTDPILTGREELGFSKIYAELPEPRFYGDNIQISASWLGFKFLDMELVDMQPVPMDDGPPVNNNDAEDGGTIRGLLHYKYFPRTEEWGTADVSYPVISPSGNSNSVVKERLRGNGSLKFHNARWEDMPTQYQIVNAFAELEIREFRGAILTRRVGGGDLSDQRILR